MKQLTVIYEDNHLLVVDKPAGIPVQADSSGALSLLEMGKDYIKQKYAKPGDVFLGLVHRLDRPTSGVIVFARTSKAASRLFEQFKGRTVKKSYLALVEGETPLSGHWIDFLRRDEKRSLITDDEADQRAELRFSRLAYLRGVSRVEIALMTGRHHQIRAQFAHHGYPLLGDRFYGKDAHDPRTGGELALHAHSLTLLHPTLKDERTFISPPAGFWTMGV